MPEGNFYFRVFKENPSDLDTAIKRVLDEFGIVPSSMVAKLLDIPTRTAIMRLRKLERWNEVYVVTEKRVNFWSLV